MEDVLKLYHLPYDANIPLVCMDEKPYQMLGETREPLPVRPGSVAKQDFEYERHGTCSIFLFTEPLAGICHADAQLQRTATDWACQIKELLTVRYPNVPLIRLVMDNLNTHGISSLYKAFPSQEARQLAKRLEIHHTPKHGSWLNIAEVELSALSKQCLNRRISDVETLNRELSNWEKARNAHAASVHWQFTVDDARAELYSLYPKVTS
jgi:hypothetical protein